MLVGVIHNCDCALFLIVSARDSWLLMCVIHDAERALFITVSGRDALFWVRMKIEPWVCMIHK